MEIYEADRHYYRERGHDDAIDIHSWCPGIDKERSIKTSPEPTDRKNPTAIEQMEIISRLPYTVYCAMMPDSHAGQNMPIGGVVACKDVVVPDFVGVDIGCGMCAIKTSLTEEDLTDDKAQTLFNLISEKLPVGFSHNTDKRRKELKNQHGQKYEYIIDKSKAGLYAGRHNPIGNAEKEFFAQLGTLGGGNHFMEVQFDEEGFIWIMIHSGSRNMGKRIGDYFNNLAADRNAMWLSDALGIPFLPTDSEEGDAYLAWMDFALRFAFLNRQVMIESVKECFERIFPTIKYITREVVEDVVNKDTINIHHNFAAIENHHGKNVWVHRKGATKAFSGMTGIIPGSMGTNSYIVRGLGNHLSLMSCSHGAGRKMGRREFARKMKNSFAQIEKSLDGVIHTEFGEFSYGKDKGMKDVSEAPAAYKDIDEVMANQTDLVEVIVKLRPRISIKG